MFGGVAGPLYREDTPPLNRQTLLKTLPFLNFLAGSKNSAKDITFNAIVYSFQFLIIQNRSYISKLIFKYCIASLYFQFDSWWTKRAYIMWSLFFQIYFLLTIGEKYNFTWGKISPMRGQIWTSKTSQKSENWNFEKFYVFLFCLQCSVQSDFAWVESHLT